jgi:1-acyl-sn-glycerol-3-phosphate acyltransferase
LTVDKIDKIFYFCVRMFFKVLLILYNRLSIKWTERLPEDQNVIVACNHCSNLDPVVVGVAFPRRLRYFAKEELFRSFLFGKIIRTLGAVPVSRADNNAAAAALKGFLKFLEEGSDILIFPEGARSPDGKLQSLEGGVGLIAVHAKATVLPVFVKGTYDAMPLGTFCVKPRKITVTFGKPILFNPQIHKGKEAREKIMTELADSLRALEAS